MSLCEDCLPAWEQWHDYRHNGPLGRWRVWPLGNPGSDGIAAAARASADNLRSAREERKSLSEWQCALVMRLCAEQHWNEEVSS